MKGIFLKNKLIVILLLALTLYLPQVEASNLEDLVEEMKDKANFGIYIKSLTGKSFIFTYQEDEPLVPASNQKILTSTAAYFLLDHDYRFLTELLWEEDSVKGSTYQGSLVLRGSGDPTLSSIALMEEIKNSPLASLDAIEGDIYIDDTIFALEAFHPDWGYELAEESGGLVFGDTTLCQFGDPPLTLSTNMGRTLQMILGALGVKHQGKIISHQKGPEGLEVMLSLQSDPLIELVAHATKFSDNQYSEQLFKIISAQYYGEGSWQQSSHFLYQFYEEKIGLDPEKYLIRDGSGLSYQNKISPEYLGRILEYGYKNPLLNQELEDGELRRMALDGEHPYLNLFSISGEEGTLHSRLTGLRVYAKTGTLKGVDALSGFLLTRQGNVILFSFLVNDFQVSRTELRNWEDKILMHLNDY